MSHNFLRECDIFFPSRRRHTILQGDWSSDVCSSDLFDGPPTRRLEMPWPYSCTTMPASKSPSRSGLGLVQIYICMRGQIGRASCREREKSPGGAGMMKRRMQREVQKHDGGESRERGR